MSSLTSEVPSASSADEVEQASDPYMRVEGGVGRPAALTSAYPNASRQALATACEVSLSHICKIFNGYTPSLALAGRLARALGVTVEELSEELERKRVARVKRERRGKHKKGKAA